MSEPAEEQIARLTRERDEMATQATACAEEVERLKIVIRDREWKRDLAEQEVDQLTTALAESERKRVEAEAEITATRARLPESLRDGKLEFGVANLAMGYRGANDGRWRYGYAMRMLLQFVDRAAGEGLAFLETEDGEPAIDAADLCADVANLLRVELDSDTFRALAKPPTEKEIARLYPFGPPWEADTVSVPRLCDVEALPAYYAVLDSGQRCQERTIGAINAYVAEAALLSALITQEVEHGR